MFDERRFLNFIDLPNFRARNRLQKTPVEQAIKDAFRAFNSGKENILCDGKKIRMDYSRNKKIPYFHIPASIHASAWVYQTGRGNSGDFVKLELGILAETIKEEVEGVQSSDKELLTITGRVKEAAGGDPSVFFYDPYQKAYAQGFADALEQIDIIAGDKLRKQLNLHIIDIIGDDTLDDIENAGARLKW